MIISRSGVRAIVGVCLLQSLLFANPIHFWPFYGSADGASTINATLTSDRFSNPDYAYQFDGVSSYIEYADNPSFDITGELSIETWVYLDSAMSDADRTLLVKAESTSDVDIPNTYSLGTSGDSTYRFCIGGQEMLFGEVTFNEWTHLAVTFSHQLMRAKCYVNNELVLDRPALLYDIQTSAYPLLIGSDAEHDRTWHGVIDDIRVFDRVISVTEVDSLYSLTFGPHIQMMPEYELDFGSLYIGYPDTLDLLISNIGLGLDSLVVSELTYTGSVFEIDQTPFSLVSGAFTALPIVFNPGIQGYFSDLVQISTNDPWNPNITYRLTGRAVFPPEIAVFPESIQDTLYTGGVGEYTITIDNSDGLGDLHWSIELLNDLDADTIYFEKEPWTDWALPASQDSISETIKITREVDYYGLFNAALEIECDERYSPLGTLWGMGRSVDVPYENYRYWISHVREPPSIVLDTTMSLRIIESNEHYDLVFDTWMYEHTGAGYSYYRIEAPDFVSGFSQRGGVLPPGASINITQTIDTYKAQQSSFNSVLQITSNDLDEHIVNIPIALEILEAPDVQVAQSEFNFTPTYIGQPDTVQFEITNIGYGTLSIQDVYSSHASLIVEPTSFEIAENSSEYCTLIYDPQSPEDFAGVISIISDDPDEGTLTIPVEGSGNYPPEISIIPESVQEEITLGDTLTSGLTIANVGTSTLNYEVYPFTSVYDTMMARSPYQHAYTGDGKYHRLLYNDADEDSVTVDLQSLSYSISSDTVKFFITTYHDLYAYWYMNLQIDYDRNVETGISDAEWWRDGSDYVVIINQYRVSLFRWGGVGFGMIRQLDPPNFTYGENHLSISLPTHLVRESDGWNIALISEMDLYQFTDIMPEFDEPPITIPMWSDEIEIQNDFGTVNAGSQAEIGIEIIPSPEDTSNFEGRLVILSNDPESSEIAVPIHLDIVVSIVEQLQAPSSYELKQNYPNPFNPSTTIRYGLPETSDVSIAIYDIRGREVISWQESQQGAGWYDLQWSGLTRSGVQAPAGMYFTRLVAGEYSSVVKMVYLK